ncbi:MAG: hypothetical protein LBR07_00215 [Puniceicoccales bacterium]|nr:hypothetical protein [Puniceicoccales bacterium]
MSFNKLPRNGLRRRDESADAPPPVFSENDDIVDFRRGFFAEVEDFSGAGGAAALPSLLF